MYFYVITLQNQQAYGEVNFITQTNTSDESDPVKRFKAAYALAIAENPGFKGSVVMFYHVEPLMPSK